MKNKRQIILEVVSVKVRSDRKNEEGIHLAGTDFKAKNFLEEKGFQEVEYIKDINSTKACSLEYNADFLFEYGVEGNSCRIIHLTGSGLSEVDTGQTMYPPMKNPCAPTINVCMRGTKMIDWELVCQTPDAKLLKNYKEKTTVKPEQSSLDTYTAVKALSDAGETNRDVMAEKVGISKSQVATFQSLQSLRPELLALIGPKVPKEDRLQIWEATVICRIHPDHQLEIWDQVKNLQNHTLVVKAIRELGGPFFRSQRRGNFKKP